MIHAAPILRRVVPLLFVTVVAGCERPGTAGFPDFTGLVAKASPSVVNISTTGPTHPDDASPAAAGGDQLPDWYRRAPDEVEPGSDGAAPPAQEDEQEPGPDAPQSLGSGFILWED